MNKLELFVLKWTGIIITEFSFLAILGCIFVNSIRGYPFHIGKLQVLGIIIFSVSMFFGMFATKFLWQVRRILEDYLRS